MGCKRGFRKSSELRVAMDQLSLTATLSITRTVEGLSRSHNDLPVLVGVWEAAILKQQLLAVYIKAVTLGRHGEGIHFYQNSEEGTILFISFCHLS